MKIKIIKILLFLTSLITGKKMLYAVFFDPKKYKKSGIKGSCNVFNTKSLDDDREYIELQMTLVNYIRDEYIVK